MLITHKIQMDIQRLGVMPYLDVVCGDTYTRQLEMTLSSGGSDWTVPGDVSAVVRYSRSDGHGGLYDRLQDGKTACTINGNVVTAILAPQVLSAPGFAKVSVALVKGELVLGTFPVGINIKADPSMGVTKGENYYNYPSIGTINAAIGDLSKLQTTANGNLVEAINEAARSSSNSSQNAKGGIWDATCIELLRVILSNALTASNQISNIETLASKLAENLAAGGSSDSGGSGGGSGSGGEADLSIVLDGTVLAITGFTSIPAITTA